MSAKPETAAAALLDVLRLRAEMLARTRAFFAERDVLEVETPLLASGLVVDAHIDPITCDLGIDDRVEQRYLLPSPEAPMKRLLAAGSGPIYQIARAFRRGESGRQHRPEFTMLEWYRPGFDHHTLMDEVGALMTELLGIERWETRTYGDVFTHVLGIDPHRATAEDLHAVAVDRGVAFSERAEQEGADAWLDLLFAACIEPELDPRVATFVFDFPRTQSALAIVSTADPPVAHRFELLYRGMELCNGYWELRDAEEHRQRFEAVNVERERLGKSRIEPDTALITAIESGLPPCAGVAVGFDRLLMIAAGTESIEDVLVPPPARI